MSYPNQIEASRLLNDALISNPGPWGDHSRTAGICAEKIAAACGLNTEKAYVLGVLHDIGRKFGIFNMLHVYHGYRYMMELGHEDVARICLTHSFHNREIDDYIGKIETTPEQTEFLMSLLNSYEYDDYDRLIQLCDALAGNGVVLDVEARMSDVKRRYGHYPEKKWNANLELLKYFSDKCGKDVYEVVRAE